jgi:enamine deaminase RidA (YjgF/YER057c/UK114 family)
METNTMTIEDRLRELAIELPPLVPPNANFLPYRRAGDLIYVSGKGWPTEGTSEPLGKVGAEVTTEQAYQHARQIGVYLLSVARAATGDLERVRSVVKLFGMVNAVPGFAEHAKVIDGCSDLLVDVFGERGRHARSAVGMSSLPLNFTVEIEAIFEVGS